MAYEHSPQPEPAGHLDPPRRNPPTAVGVLVALAGARSVIASTRSAQ